MLESKGQPWPSNSVMVNVSSVSPSIWDEWCKNFSGRQEGDLCHNERNQSPRAYKRRVLNNPKQTWPDQVLAQSKDLAGFGIRVQHLQMRIESHTFSQWRQCLFCIAGSQNGSNRFQHSSLNAIKNLTNSLTIISDKWPATLSSHPLDPLSPASNTRGLCC